MVVSLNPGVAPRRFVPGWVLLTAAIALFAGLLAYSARSSFLEIKQENIERLTHQVRSLDQNISSQLVAGAEALKELRRRFPERWDDPSVFAQMRDAMMTTDKVIPGVSAILLLDADGILIAASRDDYPKKFDFGDWDIFKEVKNAPASDKTLLSSPYVSAVGIYVMSFILPVLDRDEKFTGAFVANLAPEFFGPLLNSARFHESTRVFLIHGGGKLFLMRPAREGTVGLNRALPGSFFTRHMESGQQESVIEGVSPVLKDRRIVVNRTISPSELNLSGHLVVNISHDSDVIFNMWRQNTIRDGISFSFFAAGFLLLFYIYRTAIEKSKAAQREETLRLQMTARAGNVGLWDWDLATSKAFFSPEWKSQIGHEDHEILGDYLEWETRLHPDDRTPALENLQRFLANPDIGYNTEYRLRHKDGSHRWILAQGSMLRDVRGKPTRVMGCHLDITNQRNLEEQLRQAQKMEAVGQLTAGVAHDFNNLLMVVMSNLELLGDSIQGGKERKYLLSALGATERGASLTKQLLAFGRRMPLRPEPTDLDALITELRPLLERTLGEAIRIELKLAPGLARILVDRNQLEQALINLALNARDALVEKGTLTLTTSEVEFDDTQVLELDGESKGGRYVVIEVIDTGVGMPPELAARAFEPFFTTKGVGKGSGLGMAMVYGFVRQSGGYTRIESAPGRGTTVSIYLPVVAESAPAKAADQPVALVRFGRILLVEDNEDVRYAIVDLLRSLGYWVMAVENGPAALELAGSGVEFDLLLCDVVLTGPMTGLEVARRLHALRPGLKTVFISGYPGGRVAPDAELVLDGPLLQKPVTRDALAQAIDKALGHAVS